MFGGKHWYLNFVGSFFVLLNRLCRSHSVVSLIGCFHAHVWMLVFSFNMSLAHPRNERFPICARIDVCWWKYYFGMVVQAKCLIRVSVIKWTLFLKQASNVWIWLLSCLCSYSFCLNLTFGPVFLKNPRRILICCVQSSLIAC